MLWRPNGNGFSDNLLRGSLFDRSLLYYLITAPNENWTDGETTAPQKKQGFSNKRSSSHLIFS